MAGRDAAAFIRRRRLIMASRLHVPAQSAPAIQHRETLEPADGTLPDIPRVRSTSYRRAASEPLSTPNAPPVGSMAARSLLGSSGTSSVIGSLFPSAIHVRTDAANDPSILDFPSSLGRFETVTSFRSVTVARADTAERRRP